MVQPTLSVKPSSRMRNELPTILGPLCRVFLLLNCVDQILYRNSNLIKSSSCFLLTFLPGISIPKNIKILYSLVRIRIRIRIRIGFGLDWITGTFAII